MPENKGNKLLLPEKGKSGQSKRISWEKNRYEIIIQSRYKEILADIKNDIIKMRFYSMEKYYVFIYLVTKYICIIYLMNLIFKDVDNIKRILLDVMNRYLN